jgi:hypothetical protein
MRVKYDFDQMIRFSPWSLFLKIYNYNWQSMLHSFDLQKKLDHVERKDKLKGFIIKGF